MSNRIAAETGDGHGVGVVLRLPPVLAAKFPLLEEDPSPPHVTFLYVGEVPESQWDALMAALSEFFLDVPQFAASFGGLGNFDNPEGLVTFSPVTFSADLESLRHLLWDSLSSHGFEVADAHSKWVPHVTLSYSETWKGIPPQGTWRVESFEVWGLPSTFQIPLNSERMNRISKMRARVAAQWSSIGYSHGL